MRDKLLELGCDLQPHYRLVYMDGRGIAETARMIFAIAEVDYEDERISYEDWDNGLKDGQYVNVHAGLPAVNSKQIP